MVTLIQQNTQLTLDVQRLTREIHALVAGGDPVVVPRVADPLDPTPDSDSTVVHRTGRAQ